ncbi:hypothetical protein Q1695_012825 [Nippostrongylus brasiliensis]|nr:hypothetical protein Q1695_012825 [Nippostrongylus brasiliensis]
MTRPRSMMIILSLLFIFSSIAAHSFNKRVAAILPGTINGLKTDVEALLGATDEPSITTEPEGGDVTEEDDAAAGWPHQ